MRDLTALLARPRGLFAVALAGLLSASFAFHVAAQAPAPAATLAASVDPATRIKFDESCAACHGVGGVGGDRAPSLLNNPKLRTLSDAEIGAIIHNGVGGMPPFPFENAELARYVAFVRALSPRMVASTASAGDVAAGKAIFYGRGDCASCHMIQGLGGANGPDLTTAGQRMTPEEIGRFLDDPTSQMGRRTTASCPGWAFCPDIQWGVVTVRKRDGSTLRGFARNESEHSLQLQGFDGKFHLLSDRDYVSIVHDEKSYMPPFKGTAEEKRQILAYLGSLTAIPLGPQPASRLEPSADVERILVPRSGEWTSYNGTPSGNRHSPLRAIDRSNVDRLQLQWLFQPGGTGLETTPIVMDGVMYVTGAKQICAVDAANGRAIWCVARNGGQPGPAGNVVEEQRQARVRVLGAATGRAEGARPSAGVASGNGPNRGAAILGERIYFVSDDAYLVCINRLTGGTVWVVPLPEKGYKGRYYATAAPFVIDGMVISGMSGGDTPTRGSLAAFDAATGKQLWRFWTIPAPGEPLAKEWRGTDITTGGAATWMTGSYDRATDTLYWAVGNPYPSTDGSQRLGSNLYASSLLALNPRTGKLKWHYQFTPHDLHDWDSTSPLVLADTKWGGRDRKLIMQANRNGFFYVLDRVTGQFLLGKPFVQKMTWAEGIDANGVPILKPGNIPNAQGVLTCPAVRGATNWFASAFNPETRLFYVMAAEDCSVYRTAGNIYGANVDVKNPGRRYLRALDIETGKLVWEKPLTGSQEANYSGVLSTAGGIVFHGETQGGFAAVDAKTGETLWHFPANDSWRASPMTYTLAGRQYVAVAAGANILSFSLPEK